jgi:hypothetical protein
MGMSTHNSRPDPPGLEFANANRAAFPVEQLIPYEGRYVAWSADSTRILASGADLFEVERNVVAAGLDPSQVIYEFIPVPL